MFTENSKPVETRRRGRPSGRTPRGHAARRRLYHQSIKLFAARGYEATTLREIATEAGVSPALLYRYFPSKRAVLLTLYEELSAEYARRAMAMPAGTWRERFRFALRTSLAVLAPHRATIAALVPVLVGDPSDGVFADSTAFSRRRVQSTFEEAVAGSIDAPPGSDARALGRILYLAHLAILLWWALDRSPGQRATDRLVALAARLLPAAALALRLRRVRRLTRLGDELLREGLFGEPVSDLEGRP